MDVQGWLMLLVIVMVLWTYIPAPIRAALRGGLGPSVHAIAQGVRAVARPAWRITYAGLCRLYGVKDYDAPEPAAPAYVLSSEAPRTTLGGSGGGTNQGSRTTPPPPDIIADLLPHLAALKKPDSSYWFSANEIAAKVGGTRADALARVREIREPEPEPAPFPPQPDIDVPAYEAPPQPAR